ncbi:hypothetical protein PAMC26577_06605 [Caballeronia sordidicola]|uniref:Uncharacterized protein n=1 Tax=Caballeronia sordidicola TaxID=196367 RepID=A0A242N566_CABSO|nr:hypothetical protein PAMC26577_06605 [Caballeronia sordidicola]
MALTGGFGCGGAFDTGFAGLGWGLRSDLTSGLPSAAGFAFETADGTRLRSARAGAFVLADFES